MSRQMDKKEEGNKNSWTNRWISILHWQCIMDLRVENTIEIYLLKTMDSRWVTWSQIKTSISRWMDCHTTRWKVSLPFQTNQAVHRWRMECTCKVHWPNLERKSMLVEINPVQTVEITPECQVFPPALKAVSELLAQDKWIFTKEHPNLAVFTLECPLILPLTTLLLPKELGVTIKFENFQEALMLEPGVKAWELMGRNLCN